MMNHFGNNNGRSLLARQRNCCYRRHKSNPHIDRHNVFPMSYEKPNAVAKSPENCYDLTETMDVAYALNEICGIYHRKGPIIDVGWLRQKQTLHITTSNAHTAHHKLAKQS
ncbi:hypothetical protein EVAR_85945_1 [Eumeta japonica]|uniref:Uncharacterized protein n=1 Tax=Eumeta variegata TaxID=151549 RepID=A0A4C2A327_EUMVA|nr:hypothetical protein EVAR_85945_1 [Eumeta japonica]